MNEENRSFKKEIILSIFLISGYFLLVTLANMLSRVIGVPNSVNAAVEILFPVAVIVCLRRKNQLSYYGIASLRGLDFKNLLFLLPIIIVALCNLRYGININSSPLQLILNIIEMAGVGFCEEILFRGFLMKAVMLKNSKAGILSSGIIFSLVHITNLFSGAPARLVLPQIVYSFSLGLMFSVFVFRTNNIIPCMVCHSLINVTSIFLPSEMSVRQMYTGWLILIFVPLLYSVYLYKTKKSLIKSSAS